MNLRFLVPGQICLFSVSLSLLFGHATCAQSNPVNYDEAKVGTYTLPDPLILTNGEKVQGAKTWTTRRRPELLNLFTTQVYGRSPGRPEGLKFEVTSVATNALGGKATRKEVRAWFKGGKDGPWMDILLYIPNLPKPVPAFVGLNFGGNQSVSADPDIKLPSSWVFEGKGVVDHRATETSRGSAANAWQVEMIVARGYALATACYGDIEPDHAEGWKVGVRGAFGEQGAQTQWKPDDWGAISAWAWGLSRVLDYLEQDSAVDARRVAVMGHSRLGKTALWAGAGRAVCHRHLE